MNKIIIVDKPYGLTSSYVVNKLKKYFGASKAGHSGTLDPLATGVLVVYFDDMTKIIPFIDESIKKYEVKILFGIETDTLDISGEILRISKVKDYSDIDFLDVVTNFIGDYNYTPPSFSAIKIKGVRSYKYARQGRSVDLPKRKSIIKDIKIVNNGTSVITLIVESSKGTYIRALARDIGSYIGSFSTVSKLERLGTGRFKIGDSNNYYSILDGKEPSFFPLNKLFPLIEIDDNNAEKILKQRNYKMVDLQELIGRKIEDQFVVMVNNDIPLLITTNKFDNNKKYICSEIKFFSKKN
ncbi:tRNA pseudouridine(55) synthase TruB [bacterium]|jgi:tRNA pseudouridine55 synthase|nr:tRNA pseudouridine(55) synthase TruB [bacterium]MBT3795682.1 tRNA pseudouridine(55) synthase TruB [bacterium]MBT4634543.1 tRNA pseudouridine(55) synthase TruB [bacterium]